MKKILFLVLVLTTSLIAAEGDEESLIAAVDNLGPTASGFLSDSDFGPEDEDLIDLSVPRNVNPCLGRHKTITLLNVDQLSQLEQGTISEAVERQAELFAVKMHR